MAREVHFHAKTCAAICWKLCLSHDIGRERIDWMWVAIN
jgi:hypothetical protein